MQNKLEIIAPLADAMIHGFVITDLDGRILLSNSTLAQWIGCERGQELVGQDLDTILASGAIVDGSRSSSAATVFNGGKCLSRYRLGMHHGGTLAVEESAFLVRDDQGRPEYLAYLIQGIDSSTETDTRVERERALQNEIINALPGVFYLFNRQGRFVRWNSNLERLTGRNAEEIATTSPLAFFDTNDAQQIAESIERVFVEGHTEVEGTLRGLHGEETPCLFSGHRIFLDGEPHLIGVGVDITELKRAQNERALLASAFEHSPDAMLVTDAQNRILTVNSAFTRMTGYSADEVMGKNPSVLSSGLMPNTFYERMWRAILTEGSWHGEVWDRRKDGSLFPKALRVSAVRDARGRITHHIASFTDITERKRAEERIRFLAMHDPLTRLPNRTELRSRLTQALATAGREQHKLAVMFIDLDRFKLINDTLGHSVGDELLVEVSQRLLAAVRTSDIVARLGGDEFIVVLNHVEGRDAIDMFAKKVLDRLGEPFLLSGQQLHTAASIGVSVFPYDGEDSETLMRCADTAMYHAKSVGRGTFRFFDADLNRATEERLHFEQRLRDAVSTGQLILHYQPQVESRTGNIVGLEALVRWMDPEMGLISPERFIPVAEECGLIGPIGAWVLDEAIRQLAVWRRAGHSNLSLSVNLSAHELKNPDLPPYVSRALVQHGVPPGHLELEVTETAAMGDPHLTIDVLGQLKTIGVELTIDDFGTGYSSLSYLKLLPVGSLKIDRSFVQDMEIDANDAAICAATISLAHNLGLRVVAEGVETATQCRCLTELGCDFMQGYYFGAPAGAEETLALLLERHAQGKH